MKNILAENMLRFGVKNLSEKSKEKLAEQSPVTGLTTAGPVKSILALPAVNSALSSNNATTIVDKDPNIKFITINTPADKPVQAVITLWAVNNRTGATVCKIGNYNLVLGNIGQYDSKNTTILTPKLQACLFTNDKLVKSIPIGSATLKMPDGIAQLFANICFSATGQYAAAAELYPTVSGRLKQLIQLNSFTNKIIFPTKPEEILAFNEKVDSYIPRA